MITGLGASAQTPVLRDADKGLRSRRRPGQPAAGEWAISLPGEHGPFLDTKAFLGSKQSASLSSCPGVDRASSQPSRLRLWE